MNKAEVESLVRQAIELTSGVQEEYRIAAFQEVLRHLMTFVEKTPTIPQGRPTTTEIPLAESIGEFLRRVSATAHTDITLTMGYYLLKQRNSDAFTIADLESLYAEARHPKTNINLAIIGNIKKGLMLDTGEKRDQLKTFAITRLGEEHVETRLLKPRAVGD